MNWLDVNISAPSQLLKVITLSVRDYAYGY